MITRFTTPVLTLTVPVDITGSEIHVTMRQGDIERDIKADSAVWSDDVTTITIPMSQEETGAFKAAPVKMQINWITADGTRCATKQKLVNIMDNLLDEVVDYGG